MGQWRDFDWYLLGLVLLVCLLGVVEIYTSTHGTRLAGASLRQLAYIVMALGVMFLLSRISYHRWLAVSHWLYGACLLALVGVLAVGQSIFHSRRWIPILGVHLQVSEFAKLVIIVVVARYCSELRRVTWLDIVRLGTLVGLPMVLVALEPDLGTALTYAPIAAVGLFLGGLSWRQGVALLLLAMLVLPLGWHELKPYQKARLENFMNPSTDPLGRGYQLLQSKIAVGSGGFWGQGQGRGTQVQGAFLPVSQADFIAAAFAEERGLVGVAVLLGLYFLILMRLLADARTAPDRAGTLLVVGVAVLLAFHILVNLGMVVGFMPVTGIPLPFMSSGGSSLLFLFAALGVVMNVHMRRLVN